MPGQKQLGPHRAKCSVQTGDRGRRKISMGENGCSVLFPYRQSLPENAQREHGQTLPRCGEMCKSRKLKRVSKTAAPLPAPSRQMLSTKSRSLARHIWFQLPVPQPQLTGLELPPRLRICQNSLCGDRGTECALGSKIPDHPVKHHR